MLTTAAPVQPPHPCCPQNGTGAEGLTATEAESCPNLSPIAVITCKPRSEPGAARGGGRGRHCMEPSGPPRLCTRGAAVGTRVGQNPGETSPKRRLLAPKPGRGRSRARGAVPSSIACPTPPPSAQPSAAGGGGPGTPRPHSFVRGKIYRVGKQSKDTPPARPRDGSEAAMAQWDTGGVIAPVWVGSASPSPLRSQGHAVPPGRHGAMGHSGGHGAHPLGPTSPQHHRHPVRWRGSDPRPWDVPEVLAEGGER